MYRCFTFKCKYFYFWNVLILIIKRTVCIWYFPDLFYLKYFHIRPLDRISPIRQGLLYIYLTSIYLLSPRSVLSNFLNTSMHQSVQAATQSTINWAPYNQKFIFSVLEVKSSRSGCQCGWVLLRSHFLACREPSSYSVLTWQGEIASFLVFLLRRPLISSWSPTLMTSCEPNYLLKAPSLNYIHRGLELKHINWGGGILT